MQQQPFDDLRPAQLLNYRRLLAYVYYGGMEVGEEGVLVTEWRARRQLLRWKQLLKRTWRGSIAGGKRLPVVLILKAARGPVSEYLLCT